MQTAQTSSESWDVQVRTPVARVHAPQIRELDPLEETRILTVDMRL